MAAEKTRDVLIAEAFNNVISGDEGKMAYAVMLLRKAREKNIHNSKHSELDIDLYIKFIEVLSGINDSKGEICKSFLDSLMFGPRYIKVNSALDMGKIEIDGTKMQKVEFLHLHKFFLENNLVEYWIKSLKYDALIKQFGEWEEEGKADQEKLNRIKEIIGK